jgi:hypothetical protein
VVLRLLRVENEIVTENPVRAIPVESEAIDTTEAQQPVLSEGVIRALNCTYDDYISVE